MFSNSLKLNLIIDNNMTTPKDSVRIRLANLSDLKPLIDLHLRCFTKHEHLAVRLGASYIHAVYHWFITSSDTFTLVAEYSGKIVGLTTVCDRSYNGLMLRNTLKQFIIAVFKRPFAIFHWEFLSRLINLISRRGESGQLDHYENDVSHLAFIAVDGSMRGKGVGVRLLEEAKSISLERGFPRMRAGVYKQNSASIRMFAKAGYQIVPDLETSRTHFVEVIQSQ